MLGAVMLVAASLWLGAALVISEKRRNRLLDALISSLEILRGEISTRLTPLPDCARLLAESGPEACREFYSSVYSASGVLGEVEFSRLWDACLSVLDLDGRARAALSDLGRSLGRYSADEQRAAIDRCLAELGLCAGAARERAQKNMQLRLGLPLAAGLLLAVMLY